MSKYKWKTTEFHANGKLLGSVLIRRRIFEWDSFLPLPFVIPLPLSLTHVLREIAMGYQLEKNGKTVHHFFSMDDLKTL